MTTSTARVRHIGRLRLLAVMLVLLGLRVVVVTGVWAANRSGPPPDAANPARSPTAAAKPPASSAAQPASKRNTGTPHTSRPKATATSSAYRAKLPAGIAEPGRTIAAPVDVKKTSVADSVRVGLIGFTSVESRASGLGEVSAPAVRLSIRLTNTGAKRLPLDYVVVNANYGTAGTPGILLAGDPASRPFTGSLAPGTRATGVFVFNMPVSKRGDATITVSPSPTLPIAIFAGSVS